MPVDFIPKKKTQIQFTPVPKVEMPDAGKMVRSGASKAWDWLNTSVLGVEEPTPEEMQTGGIRAAERKGISMMTTPLTLGGELLGGAGAILGGMKYLKGAKAASTVGKAAEETSELARARRILEAYEGKGSLKGKTSEEILAAGNKLDPLKYEQGSAPLKAEIPPIILGKHGGAAHDEALIKQLSDEIEKTKKLEFVNPDEPPTARLRRLAGEPVEDTTEPWVPDEKFKKPLGGKEKLKKVGGEVLQDVAHDINTGSMTIPEIQKKFGVDANEAQRIWKENRPVSEIGKKAKRIRKVNPEVGRQILNEISPPRVTIPDQPWSPVGEIPSRQMELEIGRGAHEAPPANVDFQRVGTVPEEQTGLGFGKDAPLPPEKKPGLFRQILREQRNLQVVGDLSFPLRQGITEWTRPEFWKSFKPMIESALTPQGFARVTARQMADKDFQMLKDAGVEFTNLLAPGSREESLKAHWLEQIPGIGRIIKGSNQGYTAFANELRLGVGKRLLQDAKTANIDFLTMAPGKKINPNLKAIARFVNDTTGRGNLGRFEKSATELNDFIFSPKLIASRVNMLNRGIDASLGLSSGGKFGTNIMDEAVSPMLAKQLRQNAIRSLVGIGALAAGSTTLGILNGAKGTDDPRSTDFGKLKIGNTRVDYTGGFQQYIRLGAQLATGKFIGMEGNVVDPEGRTVEKNKFDIAERFGTNKLAPAASLVVDWMRDQDPTGEKFTWKREAYDRLVPLIVQDLQEIYEEDPKSLPWVAPSVFFGASASSYGPKRKGDSNLFGSPFQSVMPRIQ